MPIYRKKTTKDNKRKKVVKGKSLGGRSKFKSVTNKKTGKTTYTIKTKARKENDTKKSKTKTVVKTPPGMGSKAVSSKIAGKLVMESLLKMTPTSKAAEKAMKAIKKNPKMPGIMKKKRSK